MNIGSGTFVFNICPVVEKLPDFHFEWNCPIQQGKTHLWRRKSLISLDRTRKKWKDFVREYGTRTVRQSSASSETFQLWAENELLLSLSLWIANESDILRRNTWTWKLWPLVFHFLVMSPSNLSCLHAAVCVFLFIPYRDSHSTLLSCGPTLLLKRSRFELEVSSLRLNWEQE